MGCEKKEKGDQLPLALKDVSIPSILLFGKGVKKW